MSNIIAMCPYCRVGGVRAPATALGASATCPRCKSSFTVMPSESPSGGVAAPAAETVSAGALDDVTEPSPLLPGEERKPAKARPKPPGEMGEMSPPPPEKSRPRPAKSKYPVAKVIAPPPPRPADVGIGSVVAPPAEPVREPAPTPAAPASAPSWGEVIDTTYPLEEIAPRRGAIAERSAPPSPHPARPASRSEPPSPARGEGEETPSPLAGEGGGVSSPGEGKASAPAPKPKAAPAAAEEAAEPEEAMDYGMVFALGALILVGPAVLASQLPFGRFVAAGLGVVGLLGGIAALGSEGRARTAAAGAVFLHAMILLVVFFIPSVLNLDPWLGNADDTGPEGPFVVEHQTGVRTPLSPDTSIEANRSSWEYRDVRVTVAGAYVGPVELRGPKDARRKTRERYFQVQLRLANAGVERQIDLSGWAAGQGTEGVRVTDAAGKALALATFEGAWQPDRGRPARQLLPGHPSDVRFVFAAPPEGAASVRMELSGAAFGLPDQTVKFQFGSAFLPRPTP